MLQNYLPSIIYLLKQKEKFLQVRKKTGKVDEILEILIKLGS